MKKISLRFSDLPQKTRQNVTGLLFIAPASILFLLFMLIPAFTALGLSFTSYNVFTPPTFVGLKNYIRAFSDTYFLISLVNIGKYVLMFVPAVVFLSFFLAVLLNSKLKGIKVYRVLYYLPCLTSSVASSIVWKWLMNPSNGLLNKIGSLFGLAPNTFLNDSRTALVSIVIISVWSSLASNIMIYLAALQDIPQSVYESADIEGAGTLCKMFKITLPLVSPTTFFVLTMALIGAFQVFDQIYVLTSGGPAHATTVPMYMIYTNAFKEMQMGYACAQAMVLFVLILVVTLIQRKFNKESLV